MFSFYFKNANTKQKNCLPALFFGSLQLHSVQLLNSFGRGFLYIHSSQSPSTQCTKIWRIFNLHEVKVHGAAPTVSESRVVQQEGRVSLGQSPLPAPRRLAPSSGWLPPPCCFCASWRRRRASFLGGRGCLGECPGGR